MNGQMNLHNITTINVETDNYDDADWLSVEFKDRDGNTMRIIAFGDSNNGISAVDLETQILAHRTKEES